MRFVSKQVNLSLTFSQRLPYWQSIVKAGKNTFLHYNSTVPKIVHYEARPIALVDFILISS